MPVRDEKGFLSAMKGKSWGIICNAGISVSLIHGLLFEGTLKLSQLIVSNELNKRSIQPLEGFFVKIIQDNQKLVEECDVVVLDLLPDTLRSTIAKLKPCPLSQTKTAPLFLSMVPGISTQTMEELLLRLAEKPRVIRVLANASCLNLMGCCAYAVGHNIEVGDEKFIEESLSKVGICEKVEESKLDALSAVTISGTSIIYTVIEAIIDGGIKMGLSLNMATRYAVKMAVGSSILLVSKEKGSAPVHPTTPRLTECSMSPSTAEALYALEKRAFRGSLIAAIEAAVVQARKDAQMVIDKPEITAPQPDALKEMEESFINIPDEEI